MDSSAARENMIKNQILPNRVTDPLVIEAMGAVPRDIFVPRALRGVAYVDEDLAIGDGRHLIEPLVMARMLQAARLGPADVVLDVGCGTGYSAAVLARMASTVVALESDTSLSERAAETLGDLGLDNAVVITGPLREGSPAQAPFDAIFIGGAVPEVPKTLRSQLADGGRLVAVLTERGAGRVIVVERHGDAFGQRTVFDANAPSLPGFELEDTFVF